MRFRNESKKNPSKQELLETYTSLQLSQVTVYIDLVPSSSSQLSCASYFSQFLTDFIYITAERKSVTTKHYTEKPLF